MAETGWPLIPREALPAPIPAAPIPAGGGGAAGGGTVRRPTSHADLGRQLSIFGAETTDSSPADLAGLLAGPGRLDRMGGTARISVRVDAAWRVHVLVAELVSRGLVVSWVPVATEDDGEESAPRELSREPFEIAEAGEIAQIAEAAPAAEIAEAAEVAEAGKIAEPSTPAAQDPRSIAASATKNSQNVKSANSEPVAIGQTSEDPDSDKAIDDAPEGDRVVAVSFEVRTAYSSRLNGLARSWPAAAHQLFLSGPRLRLWVAAAGEPRPGGYALGLDPEHAEFGKDHEIIDAALVRAGLAGRVSEDGRYWLILGRKRLRRLAELVGDRPPAAPEAAWPGGAAA